MSSPPGLPARRAALRLLDAVLRRGETLAAADGAAMQGVPGTADRALARAIAGETLRWLTNLDALIDSATRHNLAADAKARMVLRVMLAQQIRLGTPGHAVVATGLPLLTGGPRRLAHGVFSTLSKGQATLPDAPTLPDDIAARWGERANEIAAGLADAPPLDLSLRDPSQTQEWCDRLDGQSLAPGHVRLQRGEAITALPGYEDGDWWVQDLAASLPARLLGSGEGRRVLDLCAAPGGKTLQLAAAGWQVTALDASDRRLGLLRTNLARTNLAAEIVVADALEWEAAELFDVVLLDAPCTATGTCRRHPDVLHRIGAKQIDNMAMIQAKLLRKAIHFVKPGGQLVYAVCSLEEQEGEAQARRIDLPRNPIHPSELPTGLQPSSDGWVRTDPGMLTEAGGVDGFFIARWSKAA